MRGPIILEDFFTAEDREIENLERMESELAPEWARVNRKAIEERWRRFVAEEKKAQ